LKYAAVDKNNVKNKAIPNISKEIMGVWFDYDIKITIGDHTNLSIQSS